MKISGWQFITIYNKEDEKHFKRLLPFRSALVTYVTLHNGGSSVIPSIINPPAIISALAIK